MTYEDLLKLINEDNLSVVFDWLDGKVPEHQENTYANFKNKYILGKDDEKYVDRLKVFVGSIKDILFTPPKPTPTQESPNPAQMNLAWDSFKKKVENYEQLNDEEKRELYEMKQRLFQEAFEPYEAKFKRDYPAIIFEKIISQEALGAQEINELKGFVNNKEAFYYEKCMVVAALTISLIEQTQLDYKRLHLLIDFINQGEHEVWQRALAGLVIALDGRDRKIDKRFKQQLADLKSMPKVQEALVYMHRAFYEFKKKTVGKSPVDYLVKTIKEEDQRQLKINSKDTAKQEEEETPKPLQDISIGELIKNFVAMKNYEFFDKPQHWFLPFHEQNNLALQSLQATHHNINAEQFIKFLSRLVSWDNANKYALCFHINELPEELIEFFNELMDWVEELEVKIKETVVTKEEEQAVPVSSNAYASQPVFEQYFMDLYRFFEHYPEKKRAIHLWERKQLYKKKLLNLIAADIAQIKVNAHHHWTHKEYKQALPYLEQLTDLEPQNDQHWANVGEVCLALNKVAKAIEAYEKALAIDEQNTNWWTALGKAYLKKRDLKKPDFIALEKALVTAATLDDRQKNVRSILAFLDEKLEEHSPLLKVFRAVLECQPNIYEGWAKLGEGYHKLEKYQKASEAYEKALKLEPNDESTWYNLGSAYDDQGKYTAAIEAYEKALKIEPSYERTWYNLGISYQKQDKHSAAIEAYEKALKIEPNKPEAWNNLGFAYLATGELTKAQTHLQKALECTNDMHALAWMNLGFLALLENDPEQALALCQKSLGVYDAKEEEMGFFEKMEKAFPYLEKQGITRKAFDALKAKLREYEAGN